MERTIDRVTARALVEAGYMPLSEYIAMFGDEIAAEAYHSSPSTAPEMREQQPHRSISEKVFALLHWH
ncbi:hypothetical protein [Bradyrhizobium sp. Ai1a-2]|uniref:hypothetical protein n=1 Tax=Bradyrhizobium sp. Ai1a-2 TaxID=196490 RepID=UPI00042523AE|nr:hypothetical protein [Bradyrhizobium sp. Ai1a-2]